MQRQTLPDRRFVDLDGRDASPFEIEDLVAQGKGDLKRRVPPGLVIAHEAPLEHGHRAREHPLHRAAGERLRKGRPADGHRPMAGDVAENHRRLDVAGTIALDPAIFSEGESLELLAEVLDHVVPLKLAVDQHIETDVLLKAHAGECLGFKKPLVIRMGEFSLLPFGAGRAHAVGLRERTDGGRREARQSEAGAGGGWFDSQDADHSR